MISKRLKHLAAGLSLGLSSVGANAAIISQSYTLPSTGVPFTQNFTFNLFNGALGTLTGVDLFISTTAVANVAILNTLATPQTYSNALASVPVSVTVNGISPSFLVSTAPTAGPFSGTVGAAVGAIPTISNVFGATATATGSSTASGAQILAFIGSGSQTGTLTASALQGAFSGTASPGVFFGGDAEASASFNLRYTYNPITSVIPVPGALYMFGSGLLLIAGVIRRKSS